MVKGDFTLDENGVVIRYPNSSGESTSWVRLSVWISIPYHQRHL